MKRLKKGTLMDYVSYLDFYSQEADKYYPDSTIVLQAKLLVKHYQN